jgi:hypothetical protein
MGSSLEQRIGRSLRAVLAGLPDGASIDDSERFREFLCGLEFFLPQVLGEVYSEWRHEGLDGVLTLEARKVGEGGADIFGLCIILSDQTLTPVHLRLQAAAPGDEVSWLECRLGERARKGMVRIPYQSLHVVSKRLYALAGKAHEIDWVYRVTFGRRRP